jgi:hypothetical protein
MVEVVTLVVVTAEAVTSKLASCFDSCERESKSKGIVMRKSRYWSRRVVVASLGLRCAKTPIVAPC